MIVVNLSVLVQHRQEEHMDIAKMIDHTLLKTDATRASIDQLLSEAKQYHFASVCVSPIWVSYAAAQLRDTGVKTCTVIGFPQGATPTAVKVSRRSRQSRRRGGSGHGDPRRPPEGRGLRLCARGYCGRRRCGKRKSPDEGYHRDVPSDRRGEAHRLAASRRRRGRTSSRPRRGSPRAVQRRPMSH